MSKQLFKNAAMASDIHFGAKNNSKVFNEDIVAFFKWFIEESKQRNCDTCIILGDWHDSRSSINVLTLNYSVTVLKMLSDNFDHTYIITGNHDLFYREKREIHSLPMGAYIDNITIVDEPLEIDDCLIVPWLVDNEWKTMVKSKAKYIFSHLELPGFKMNAMVEMPDHGGLNGKHFKNQDYVFTGHFHKRQYKDNIHYIGNPFGHNYGDAGDTERGACFLEWDGKPEYINYDAGPVYHNLELSTLLDDPDKYAASNAHIKVSVDIDLSYEEVIAIRDTFSNEYTVREFKLLPQKVECEYDDIDVSEEHATIDGLVVSAISTIESDSFDINLIMDIYDKL